MSNASGKNVLRQDYINALKEIDTFVDITVDDLMEVNHRAEKYARLRETEHLRVAAIMTTPVKTVTLTCSLADVAHLMTSRRISGVPVVDDQNQLIGIVTEADFLRALGVPAHHPTHSLWHTLETMFSHNLEIKEPDGNVAELMITDVVYVTPQQSLHDVLELMKKNRIKRVVVCDEDRHVVGMVTRSDLVRLFFDRIKPATGNTSKA